jgi:hypothetical protein
MELTLLVCASRSITANYLIHDIQKSEPMTDLVDKILINIDKGLINNMLSNDDLVQIIEQCGMYLNLKTISNYAKYKGISYNGAKNYRTVVNIFDIKFIIDND